MSSITNATQNVLDEFRSTLITIPNEQLAEKSLAIGTPKRFEDLTTNNHVESYHLLQRIAQLWKNNLITDQFLIYGKISDKIFNWEIVPYIKCQTFIGRWYQQLQVLWRTVFGGIITTSESREALHKYYKTLLNFNSNHTIHQDSKVPNGNDAFCKEDTIERQWVFKGNKVNILYNYAPIGFGGERLHFLVVPKEHYEHFTDMPEKVYTESLNLTQQLLLCIGKTRNIANVYLLLKDGKDAGQTVDHTHLHVICSTSTAQDWWGKLTVIKNILWGSSPMNKNDLAIKVDSLRKELEKIQEV